MPSDEPKPTHPPSDLDRALSWLSRAIRAQTNAIRLVDAKEVANAKLLGDLHSLQAALRDASAAGVDRLADKLDLLIDVARDSRSDMRDVLAGLRAANDRLGVTNDEIMQLRMSDRYTPTHVPLPPVREETRSSPPEGVTVRHGKVIGVFGIASIGRGAKKLAPWLATTGIGAAISHLLHRLHLFGL